MCVCVIVSEHKYTPTSPARIVVVKLGPLPVLCKTDEIGEICVQSTATGSAYWGLQGKTTHTFKVRTKAALVFHSTLSFCLSSSFVCYIVTYVSDSSRAFSRLYIYTVGLL